MLCKVDTVEMMPTEHDLDLIHARGYLGSCYRGIGVSRYLKLRYHVTFFRRHPSTSRPCSKHPVSVNE